MCLPQPGPRCHSHAEATAQVTRDKLVKVNEEEKEAVKEAEAIANKYPTKYHSRYDWKKANEKALKIHDRGRYLERKLKEEEKEADATAGGLALLKERLDALENDGNSNESEKNEVYQRYITAYQTYRVKLGRYDRERGTVDGRNPSPYGSQKGLTMLFARKRELNRKADESTGEKSAKYRERALAMADQIEHAQNTKSHADAGITDRASASLMSNKEDLKTVTKELGDIKKTYEKNREEYSTTMLSGMQKIEQEQKLTGKTRSRWPAPVKREYEALETQSEEFYKTKVYPFMRRTEQLQERVAKLEEQIKLGSISARERAANKKYRRFS